MQGTPGRAFHPRRAVQGGARGLSPAQADPEGNILAVWHASAAPWARAVREGRIASRRLVTDAAILAAVRRRAPRQLIDLGCGEGWLVRAMVADGVDALGVDAVPALIDTARAVGGGRFLPLDYAAVAAGTLTERADVVTCNFSLLGEASVTALLAAVPRLLLPGGALVIQTLHPCAIDDGTPYRDGWREGSWVGCGDGFGKAAPWYFRTLAGWMQCFREAGLSLSGLDEPLHPETGSPASVVFTLVAGEASSERTG